MGHPGGPFFVNKDLGVWSIPKGEFEAEKPLAAAKREFLEETGFKIVGNFVELTPVKQKSGKIVFAWAIEKDLAPSKLKSNTFTVTFRGSTGARQGVSRDRPWRMVPNRCSQTKDPALPASVAYRA